jgi:hypothetical protein
MALAFVAAYWLATLVLPPRGLRAKYFSNDSWSGPPMLQVVDRDMSTAVLTERTADFLQRYSVEWSGCLVVHRPGVYRFTTNSDDGSELAVDDRTVVFNRGVHGPQIREGVITLTRGVHPIWMQYLQNGGTYELTVQWGLDGEGLAPLTNRSLLADARSYAGFWLLLIAPTAIGLLSAAGLWGLVVQARRIEARWSQTPFARTVLAFLAWLERPMVAIGLLILIGGAARILFHLGSTGILWPDSEVFYFTTKNILDGDTFSHDPFRTMLYPFFLAAFLRWGETPAIGAAIVATQQALGLAATVLFYFAGRRAFTPLVAFFGALLFSIHAMEMFYEISILSEILFVFVMAALLAAVARFRWSVAIWSYVLIGGLLALLTLVRPVGEWFALCVIPVIWASSHSIRRAVTATAVIAAVNLLLVLPWMFVNSREFGFFGVSIGRGMGLFTRAFEIDRLPLPLETDYPQVKEVAETGAALHWSANRIRDELNYGRGKSYFTADEELYGFTLEAVKAHAASFAANSIWRWMIQVSGVFGGARTCLSPAYGPYLCSGRMVGLSRPPFPNAPTAERRALREWLVRYVKKDYVRMPIVFAFAVLGAIAYFGDPRRNSVGLLLALAIGYTTLVPAMLEWPQDRYRLPVDALLFMFAAWGIAAMGRLIKDHHPPGIEFSDPLSLTGKGVADETRPSPIPEERSDRRRGPGFCTACGSSAAHPRTILPGP